MKDYVKENQRILQRWREKFIAEFGADNEWRFALDGIMNKGEFEPIFHDEERTKFWRWARNSSGQENQMWMKAPLRVLFLTKDENLYEDSIPAWDVRTETFHKEKNDIPISDYQISNSTFYRNEANILYGILNTRIDEMVCFPEFSYQDALKFSDDVIFARINCKKEGGKDTIDNSTLYETINRDHYLLKDQILNFDADIFLCCGSQGDGNPALDLLYEIYKDEFVYCNYDTNKGTAVHYNEKRNKLAIDIYHLAFSRSGGEIARYYEAIGAYYSFIKYLKATKGIDFTKHR